MNNRTVALITGKSLSLMAVTASRPMPGQPNTVSTTTVPVVNAARMSPAYVTGTIRVLRKACFHTTVCAGTPFDRANLTNSESSISSIADRVRRTSPAAEPEPSVMAGST